MPRCGRARFDSSRPNTPGNGTRSHKPGRRATRCAPGAYVGSLTGHTNDKAGFVDRRKTGKVWTTVDGAMTNVRQVEPRPGVDIDDDVDVDIAPGAGPGKLTSSHGVEGPALQSPQRHVPGPDEVARLPRRTGRLIRSQAFSRATTMSTMSTMIWRWRRSSRRRLPRARTSGVSGEVSKRGRRQRHRRRHLRRTMGRYCLISNRTSGWTTC